MAQKGSAHKSIAISLESLYQTISRLLVSELFTLLRALLVIFFTEFCAERRVLQGNVDLFFGKKLPLLKCPDNL